MVHETSQSALRAALPPMLAGFLCLAASVGAWALPPAAGRVSAVLGALGSGSVLVAALALVRIRVAGRPVPWLTVFFALWLGELALRLWTMASPTSWSDPYTVLAARLLLAALAMAALATGMRRVWPAGRTWSRTRALFGLQLLGLAGIALLGEPGRAAAPSFLAAAWLGFVAPYAHLFVSMRRTVRWVSARESVSEILAS